MTYRGHVQKNRVVFDEPADLPDGTPVSVRPLKRKPARAAKPPRAAKPQSPRSLAERLSSVIGKATGLPSDFAQNHDHYLHGLPKK